MLLLVGRWIDSADRTALAAKQNEEMRAVVAGDVAIGVWWWLDERLWKW